MNTLLWILQWFVALAFFATGSFKLVKSKADIVKIKHMEWANEASVTQIKLIGAAEILGALGLILPGALHIAPILTPIAAAALVLVMAGAIATHLRFKQQPTAAAILAVLSAFIAVGRFVVS